MNYDNPIYMTYTLDAASIASAADLLDVAGPKGKTGRVVAIAMVVTTGVTVAAGTVVVGDGTTANKYGTMTAPIASADAVANDFTDAHSDSNLIAADSRLVIGAGGECTAGAGNIAVTVAWF
ncbi:MAG: hypothetical protein GY752_08935 [bacterium]|nr:hypothetical protein [bacterium]